MTDVQETDGTAAEERGANLNAAGRANVRRLFWDRLDAAGVGPCKGMTRAAYDAFREDMVARLAYLDPRNLETLAELMIGMASGPRKDRCPAEVSIRNQAAALQRPPARDHRLWQSWFHSVEGPPALAGGYLVELAEYILAQRVPVAPSPYEVTRLKAAAAENARRLAMVRERADRGTASTDDLDWAEYYTRRRDALAAAVDAGIAHRAAKGAEVAE